jgi:serine/threonine protein kinase
VITEFKNDDILEDLLNLRLTVNNPTEIVTLSAEPSWEDYEMVEVLGQGTFGRVFKVKKKTSQISE